MKVQITINGSLIEWDTSVCDDGVVVNQIALDISSGKSPEDVLSAYLRRYKENLNYICPECAIKTEKKTKKKQGKLL